MPDANDSGKQIFHRLAQAIFGHIERALLDLVRLVGRDAHRLKNGSVQIFDDNPFLQGLAGPFIRRPPVQVAFTHAAPEHQNASGVGEMSVHAVILFRVDSVRHLDLIFDLPVRLALKDLELVREVEQSSKATMPLLHAVLETFMTASQDLADQDLAAIYELDGPPRRN